MAMKVGKYFVLAAYDEIWRPSVMLRLSMSRDV